MGSRTLIGGTAYTISNGIGLINGTKYNTLTGKTLINGTVKTIEIAGKWQRYNVSYTTTYAQKITTLIEPTGKSATYTKTFDYASHTYYWECTGDRAGNFNSTNGLWSISATQGKGNTQYDNTYGWSGSNTGTICFTANSNTHEGLLYVSKYDTKITTSYSRSTGLITLTWEGWQKGGYLKEYSSTQTQVPSKGTLVDTVIAPIGTYPDDGVSGSYWYVRV